VIIGTKQRTAERASFTDVPFEAIDYVLNVIFVCYGADEQARPKA
jgi:hypothetical protein